MSDIPDAPQWNDRLASYSEAIVKAERCPTQDVSQMQEFSIKTIDEREEVEKTGEEMKDEETKTRGL